MSGISFNHERPLQAEPDGKRGSPEVGDKPHPKRKRRSRKKKTGGEGGDGRNGEGNNERKRGEGKNEKTGRNGDGMNGQNGDGMNRDVMNGQNGDKNNGEGKNEETKNTNSRNGDGKNGERKKERKRGERKKGDGSRRARNSVKTEIPIEEVAPEISSETVQEEICTEQASTSHLTNVEFSSLNISEESKKAISTVLKYKYLTKVQEATLELVLSGGDVVAKARTGTGKTVAFLLPIVERMAKNKREGIAGLIISPTRELAMQIAKEAEHLTRFHKTRIGCFIGGTSIKNDMKKLRSGIDILVATPGRLQDHLSNDNHGIQGMVSNLCTLVMDEADQLLDMGFQKEILKILAYLPPNRQTLLYSATFTQSVQKMSKIALKKEHTFVDTIEEGEAQTNQHVPQEYIVCPMESITPSLEAVLNQHIQTQKNYKILVFFNTARTAGFMAQLFQKASYNVLEMHSRKNQSFRVRTAATFTSQTNILMFSSDVSARGVDYPGVTLIVQVGLTQHEQYIHRLGRTGRAGRVGRGVLLLSNFEKGFLKELRDLDIKPGTLPPVEEGPATGLLRSLPKGLVGQGEMAYQAFLGYYNSNLRRCGLDKHGVVQLANEYSETIGLQQPPKLLKRTVGKMGLKGIPGINLA